MILLGLATEMNLCKHSATSVKVRFLLSVPASSFSSEGWINKEKTGKQSFHFSVLLKELRYV